MKATNTDKLKPTRSATIIGAALLWAIAMTVSAALNLFLLERAVDVKSQLLVLFFACGAFIAYPCAIFILTWVPKHWQNGQRFAISFIIFSLFTIGFTALIFALHFRTYFAQWHDDTFSTRLVFETVFTILSAVYQFFVLALRLYLPFGLIVLLGASWGFATKRI